MVSGRQGAARSAAGRTGTHRRDRAADQAGPWAAGRWAAGTRRTGSAAADGRRLRPGAAAPAGTASLAGPRRRAAASADQLAVRPEASRSGAGSTLLRSTAVPRPREALCHPPAQRVRTAARSHRSGWTGGVRRAAVRLRCRSWRFCSFQAQSASRAELSVSFAPAVRRLGLRRKDLRTVS
ncbi:hypothetical protein PLANTIT3_60754 [Plantibacter sp. T3]|nr:hypothetical protein PLANTIT3_60754 [Plantibacter sp. T3]